MITVLILFTLFLISGMSIAFAIGLSSFTYFLTGDMPISIAIQKIASTTQNFPLLALPFFILAGNMMNATGITSRLVKFSKTLTGFLVGGLSHVTIALSVMMGGISGSAVADASMEARILGPAMLKSGFSRGYTAGIIAVSSLITATIPPGLGLILYGFMGNVSIGRLFVAGIVPGFLMAFFLMFTVYRIAKRRGYRPENERPPSCRDIVRGLNECKWALLFPVFLIVGIRYGIFTPSEAGAFAVVYALIIGAFVYRELTFDALIKVLDRSISDCGMLMLIIMLSGMVGYAVTLEQVPHSMAVALSNVSQNPLVVVFLILAFLLVLGMFIEATVIVLMMTPIFVPVITRLGVDPVHFGILMMSVVTLGCMTPPVGTAMYAVCGIIDCPLDEYTVESLPFIMAILVLIVVLAFFPQLVLFLPNLIF